MITKIHKPSQLDKLNKSNQEKKSKQKYEFEAQGHKNIKAEHKTTLELTKDNFVTEKGDCIIGINANYNLQELKKIKSDKIKITIKCDEKKDEVTGELNDEFNDDKELVVRLGTYKCQRTIMTNADKSAKYLNKKLIEEIKKGKKIKIKVESIEKTTQ